MAKNDYHVVVYRILAYLYTQLKDGNPVDPEMLDHDSKYLGVNQQYWEYIMENLVLDGYIRGPVIQKAWGGQKIVRNLEAAEITPQGIEYLCDNAFMKKAADFLREVKAIVPFI